MAGTLTLKRKAVREDIPTAKVLTRAVAGLGTPPAMTGNSTPVGIAANDPSATPRPFFPEEYKTAILAEIDKSYAFVPMALPQDLLIAKSLVSQRLFGVTMQLSVGRGRVRVYAAEAGLRATEAGDDMGTWTYEAIALVLLQRATAAKQPKKAKASPEAQSLARLATKTATVSPDTRAASRELPKPLAVGRMIELAKLERHADNRHPSQADVEARAKSLEEDGQLEDVVARQLPNGKLQIISGETRCLAARLLKWTQVRCTVIECDDAEALRLVGLYNGQRSDLNPIQKAQHIERMCAAGMTREEAARCVGLECGSAASNLVRLLKLSKEWQERIASEELPASFARVIAPYSHVAPLMQELNEAWNGDSWAREIFSSRDELEHAIQCELEKCTRFLDQSHYYGNQLFPKSVSNSPAGHYECLLTPEELQAHREELGIVTVLRKEWSGPKNSKCKSTEVETATNVKRFEEMQVEKILQQHAAKGAGKAKAAGDAAGDDAPAKTKTKAQLAEAAKQREQQLDRAVKEWRETVIRQEIKAAILAHKPTAKTIDPRILKLVLAFMCDQHSFSQVEADEQLYLSIGVKKATYRDSPYDLLSQYCDSGDATLKWQTAAIHVCAWLIGGDADHARPADLSDEQLENLFCEWSCDLTKAWQRLYTAKDPLIEEFLQLHRSAEIVKLARSEWGIMFPETNPTKGGMIGSLIVRSLPLSMPKVLALPKPCVAKAKRGGK